mgnify:CR=1 FL=1
MAQQLQIRNSTAEFLIFQAEDKSQGVQVFYQDETIWATQEAIAFQHTGVPVVLAEVWHHVFTLDTLADGVRQCTFQAIARGELHAPFFGGKENDEAVVAPLLPYPFFLAQTKGEVKTVSSLNAGHDYYHSLYARLLFQGIQHAVHHRYDGIGKGYCCLSSPFRLVG